MKFINKFVVYEVDFS